MQPKFFTTPIMVITGLLFAGCAADGSLIGSNLTTASTTPAKPAVTANKVDPACVQLTARIDAIRKEGVVDRVEKVGTGKSKTVSVYRSSLAKMAELDRANAQFQAKCSKLPFQTAAAPSAAAATAKPSTSKAAAPAAAKPAAPATATPKKP